MRWSCPVGGYRSWESEFEDHVYWASRIHDEADGSDQYLQRIEAKLLLP